MLGKLKNYTETPILTGGGFRMHGVRAPILAGVGEVGLTNGGSHAIVTPSVASYLWITLWITMRG